MHYTYYLCYYQLYIGNAVLLAVYCISCTGELSPLFFQLFKLSSPSFYCYLHTIPKRSIPLFFLVNKKRPTKTIYTIPRIPFPIKTAYSIFLRDLPIPMLLPVRWQGCSGCSFPKAQSSAFSLPVTVFRLYSYQPHYFPKNTTHYGNISSITKMLLQRQYY